MILCLFLSLARPLQGSDRGFPEESSSSWWATFCSLGNLPFMWNSSIDWTIGFTKNLCSEREYEDFHVGPEDIVPLPILDTKKEKENQEIKSITQTLKFQIREIDGIMTRFEEDMGRIEGEVRSSIKMDKSKLKKASQSKRASLRKKTEIAVQEGIKKRKVDLIHATYNILRGIETDRQALDRRIFSWLITLAGQKQPKRKHQRSLRKMEILCSQLKSRVKEKKRPLRILYQKITGTRFPKPMMEGTLPL